MRQTPARAVGPRAPRPATEGTARAAPAARPGAQRLQPATDATEPTLTGFASADAQTPGRAADAVHGAHAAASAPADAAGLRPAPLDLSSRSIRQAGAAARPLHEQMAQAAGQAPLHRPASASERLGAAVAQGAIEDCIAPDPSGLGLLNAPLIALKALRGQCQLGR